MNWKALLAILGGLLAIVCGEAIKLGLKNWADLSNFTYWMGNGIQIAGLISAYTGGLYQDKPKGLDAAATAQTNLVTSINNLAPLVLLVLLLPMTTGCAPTMKAKLQQADASVYGALKAIDKYENDLYMNKTLCGETVCVDAAGHQQFSKKFLIAVQAGKTFHASIMAWQPGQPIPVDVVNASAGVRDAADLVKTLFAAGPGKVTLAALIDAGAFAINQALALILPTQGPGAIPPLVLPVPVTS